MNKKPLTYRTGYSKSMENLTRSETRMMLVALDLLKDDYRKNSVGSPAQIRSATLDEVSNLQDKLLVHLEKLAY